MRIAVCLVQDILHVRPSVSIEQAVRLVAKDLGLSRNERLVLKALVARQAKAAA